MPLVPWYQVPPRRDYQPTVGDALAFGGFRRLGPISPIWASIPVISGPRFDRSTSTSIARPARALDFNDRGRDVIKSFICPGDRSNSTSIIGSRVCGWKRRCGRAGRPMAAATR